MMGVCDLLVVRRGVSVAECVLEASDVGLVLVSDKTLDTLLDPLKSSASDITRGVNE